MFLRFDIGRNLAYPVEVKYFHGHPRLSRHWVTVNDANFYSRREDGKLRVLVEVGFSDRYMMAGKLPKLGRDSMNLQVVLPRAWRSASRSCNREYFKYSSTTCTMKPSFLFWQVNGHPVTTNDPLLCSHGSTSPLARGAHRTLGGACLRSSPLQSSTVSAGAFPIPRNAAPIPQTPREECTLSLKGKLRRRARAPRLRQAMGRKIAPPPPSPRRTPHLCVMCAACLLECCR